MFIICILCFRISCFNYFDILWGFSFSLRSKEGRKEGRKAAAVVSGVRMSCNLMTNADCGR